MQARVLGDYQGDVDKSPKGLPVHNVPLLRTTIPILVGSRSFLKPLIRIEAPDRSKKGGKLESISTKV